MQYVTAIKRNHQGKKYKWIVLTNTTVAVFTSSLNTFLVNIALPDIARSINTSVSEIMWIIIGYNLVLTALMLPIARLADMKGRVRLYNIGFVVFTAASLLCSFAHSGTQLVGFRLVQGAGAAMLSANSTALITDAFPSSERGLAISINMVAALVGTTLGVVLGGFITDLFGWRWIFFINVPFGLVATIWAFLSLHEMVLPEQKARFDIGGSITFPLGLGSVLGGLTLMVMGYASEFITIGLIVLGILILIAFGFIERRATQPMMDFSLFHINLFWTGNTSLFLSSLARGATVFIMSWYFQTVLGDSPLTAGLKLLPLAVSILLVSPIAGLLSDRIGSRWLSIIGLSLTFVAQIWIATFSVTIPYLILAIIFIFLGIGFGLFNTPNTSAIMGCVPTNRRGIASGTRNMLFFTGQTMSIALSMVILSTVMSYHLLSDLFTGSAMGGQSVNALTFIDGLRKVFLFGAIITSFAIVFTSLRGK